jgi:hydroxymethylbilane synthase
MPKDKMSMNTTPSNIVIGTRGSDLALWQANFIKSKLKKIGLSAEIKIIKTQGDKLSNISFDKLEGKGFFTKEIEDELLNGTIDLAIHSHKDLPTSNPPGLLIAAVSEREDPADLLLILKDQVDINQKLSIKSGKTVGTSSSRRKAQLRALRPDLEVKDLRGNLQTRIQKLRDKYCHAIMVAKAGVLRLEMDLSEFYVEELDPSEFVPAPAQGVLALQIREKDHVLFKELQALNHPEVAEQIALERKVLNLFDGGCHTPLGCYCRKHENLFQVWTSRASIDSEFPDRLFMQAESTVGLAEKIVSKFAPTRKFPKTVFITRFLPENNYFRHALKKHAIEVDARSLIKTYPIIHKFDPFILKQTDWIFFSSKNAIEYFFQLKPELTEKTKLAVFGRSSEDTLRRMGRVPDFTGERLGIDITGIAKEFAKLAHGTTVLFPRAKDSLQTVQNELTLETKAIELPIYETVLEKQIEESSADVLIFTSPSNVEAYFSKHLLQSGQKVICLGKSTGKKAAEMGAPYVLPYSPDDLGLAEAVFGLD